MEECRERMREYSRDKGWNRGGSGGKKYRRNEGWNRAGRRGGGTVEI
jgi:hypothetical protein